MSKIKQLVPEKVDAFDELDYTDGGTITVKQPTKVTKGA